jgi:hypothetical protein
VSEAKGLAKVIRCRSCRYLFLESEMEDELCHNCRPQEVKKRRTDNEQKPESKAGAAVTACHADQAAPGQIDLF